MLKRRPAESRALTSSSSGSYLVGFSCTFVARSEREKPAYEYVDGLRDEVQNVVDDHFPGATVLLVADTGEPSGSDPVALQVTGDDMEKLRELSKQVQATLTAIPGAIDVRDNAGNKRLDIRMTPRRESLDFYGITHDELASQVRFAMSDQEVGRFAIDGVDEDLDIRKGTAWPSRQGRMGGPTRMDELVSMRVFRTNGETVPVMAVVEPAIEPAPLSITRDDGQRSIAIMSKVQGRVASEVIADLTPKLDELQKTWPPGYRYRMGGEAEEAAEAFGSAGKMMFVSLFMVFGLLVLLFGSFTQPFIIIEEHKTVRILEVIETMGTVPISRIWDDVRFGISHLGNISHVAVVAHAKWIEILTKVFGPLTKAKVQYFDKSEIEKAREWLRTAE